MHWLRGLLRGLADEGRTVLVSSHLLAELGDVVDDIAVLDRGRLVAHGPARDLLAQTSASSLEDLYFSLVTNGALR